jgi:hypothetical protein
MKRVICILQNAWGDRELTTVFEPNPYNKSAKVIRKMIGDNSEFYFCNTTGIVTKTAKERANIDQEHFNNVITTISLTQLTDHPYNLILVCGKQAEQAVKIKNNIERLIDLNIPIIFIPHPAARNLSNVRISQIKQEIISKW